MTSFVDQCHQIFDIDENKTIVEIYYSKYKEGAGYENLVDTFGTVTTCDFNYNDKSLVRYERFLDTMVIKTLETIHKMVLIQLDNVLFENKNINSLIRIMNSVKILDPTFSPPYINKKCSWQKKLVREICLDVLPDVIKTSTNKYNLEKLFRTLQLIESEITY